MCVCVCACVCVCVSQCVTVCLFVCVCMATLPFLTYTPPPPPHPPTHCLSKQDMGTFIIGKLESGSIYKGQSLLLMPNRVSSACECAKGEERASDHQERREGSMHVLLMAAVTALGVCVKCVVHLSTLHPPLPHSSSPRLKLKSCQCRETNRRSRRVLVGTT